MVHLLPSTDGLIKTNFNTKRSGIYIANFDLEARSNVVITPDGAGGIQIGLPTGTKLRIPDKIGLRIQAGTVGSGTRNFVVLDWIAGSAL